jgi:hypothetical protein
VTLGKALNISGFSNCSVCITELLWDLHEHPPGNYHVQHNVIEKLEITGSLKCLAYIGIIFIFHIIIIS